MARGLGPSVLVAYVCNYKDNTEFCGSNQQDCVERKISMLGKKAT